MIRIKSSELFKKLSLNKLALGTVQFGMPYGVANKSGKISFEEASNIITLAKQNHVNTLDTAIAYGDSEQVLGQIGVHDFQVITKLPVFPDDHNDLAARVENIVCNSIETLKKDSLYGFLFHSSDELLGPSGESLYAALDSLKSEGLIKKLGVSIYAPSELDLVLKNSI